MVEALQRDLKRVGDLLAHLGSDEFVALIPDTDEEGVKELAEVMRNNISDSENDERGLKIDNITKVNMGLCTVVPTKDLAPQMLIEAAGYAIEQAQKQGGNLTIMGTVKQGQHP